MLILGVDRVSFSYGSVKVLHDVSLELREGEIVSLLGPNGAGKSTLFRAISGLGKPSAGSISFAGSPISGQPAHKIVRRGLGQVAEGRQIFHSLTVNDNLLLAAHYGNRKKEKRVEELSKRVFSLFPILEERRDQRAGTLSGGQQQMLAIGKALMVEPRLLLLDEPSLGLAPIVVREIMRVLVELRRQGMEVLLIEQNAAAALGISDRAYVLESGRIKLSGSAAELACNESVKEHYLGMGATWNGM